MPIIETKKQMKRVQKNLAREFRSVMDKTKKQLNKEYKDLAREFGGVMNQNDALKQQNYILANQYKQEHEDRLRTQDKLAEIIKKNDTIRQQSHMLENQLEKCQNSLAAQKRQNDRVWDSVYEILTDSKVLEHIRGWYWHTEKHQPVYVDGISAAGLTGYSLRYAVTEINASIVDTFDFKDLIRIDVNLEMQY